MKYKYVIWDWNGTLFDDVQISIDAMNEMLERTGYEKRIDIAEYKNIFTFPVIEYYRRAGFDFERHSFDYLAKLYIEIYTRLQFTARLNGEAICALQRLAKLPVRQNIVSACEKSRLKNQIEKFGVADYFDAVLGIDDDYAAGKAQLAKNWINSADINKDEVIFIGDTAHDCEVARAAGCDVMLVACGHQSREVLAATGEKIFDNLTDVCDYIISGNEPNK